MKRKKRKAKPRSLWLQATGTHPVPLGRGRKVSKNMKETKSKYLLLTKEGFYIHKPEPKTKKGKRILEE